MRSIVWQSLLLKLLETTETSWLTNSKAVSLPIKDSADIR